MRKCYVNVQIKKAMTMTEKILARHSDNADVAPGQNIWTNVDKLMTHDVCGPGTFGIFQREFGENAQVPCPPACVVQAHACMCLHAGWWLSSVSGCVHACACMPGGS